jgi:hypothetical protein
MANLKLTNDDLAAALAGLEFERDRLALRITEIRNALDGNRAAPAASASETATPRKKRSAAVRRRMAKAQRARYARLKQVAEKAPSTVKPKRKLSAAGRKAISAATKKRWLAVKAAKEAKKAIATSAG